MHVRDKRSELTPSAFSLTHGVSFWCQERDSNPRPRRPKRSNPDHHCRYRRIPAKVNYALYPLSYPGVTSGPFCRGRAKVAEAAEMHKNRPSFA